MKSKEELLKDFIKSNKARRERLALKAGFKTAAAYKAHLEDKRISYEDYKKLARAIQLKIALDNGYQSIAGYMSKLRVTDYKANTVDPVVNTTKNKGIIYNIHILDRSGSMSGSKLENAIKGINTEIEELKSSNIGSTIKVGIVSFGDSVELLHITDLDNVRTLGYGTMGMTALNDAIGKTLTSLLEVLNTDDKAVVKIFTDGGENASHKYSSSRVRDIVNAAKSKGVTVTFIGTDTDVSISTRLYNLDKSNTLVHDNTARGVEQAYTKMSASTVTYSKTVAAGGEALTGFFKDVK